MVRVTSLSLWLVAAAIFVTGCDKPTDPEGSARATTGQLTNLQIFQVKGVVIEVQPLEASVKIKHEEVPDYMPAMTMPFNVKDTNELTGLAAGDPVSFRLLVTDTEGWIDRIQKTGPKINTPPTTGPFRRVRDVEPLNVGEVLPEYRFINQFGKRFSTTNYLGQALAIEFIFTRCPLPNFCPFMANSFAEAQKQLLTLSATPTNWQLLTLSFDPEFDTPAVLKNYADAHGYDPQHWTFATGAQIDLTAIGDQCGLLVAREGGGFSHNLRAVVIDASGRVRKIFTGNEWKPEELVGEMVKAAKVE